MATKGSYKMWKDIKNESDMVYYLNYQNLSLYEKLKLLKNSFWYFLFDIPPFDIFGGEINKI